MMRTAVALLSFSPCLLFAQASHPAAADTRPSEPITKVVHVHYADPSKIVGLIESGAGVLINGDNVLRAVVIKGPAPKVDAAVQTIKELDIPTAISNTNDIEVIVNVVEGSNEPMTSSVNNGPSSLEPVVKQLRTIFPYKTYTLLSTMLMRSQQGKAAYTAGLLEYNTDQGNGSRYPSSYAINYRSATVIAQSEAPIIHLSDFNFRTNLMSIATGYSVPSTTQLQSHDVSIGSDVDLRQGQKVVVGQTNVASGKTALFIVLSAKLVD